MVNTDDKKGGDQNASWHFVLRFASNSQSSSHVRRWPHGTRICGVNLFLAPNERKRKSGEGGWTHAQRSPVLHPSSKLVTQIARLSPPLNPSLILPPPPYLFSFFFMGCLLFFFLSIRQLSFTFSVPGVSEWQRAAVVDRGIKHSRAFFFFLRVCARA